MLHCSTVAVSCLLCCCLKNAFQVMRCAFRTLFSAARLFPVSSSFAGSFRNSSRAFHCTWDRRENGASPKSILYKRRWVCPERKRDWHSKRLEFSMSNYKTLWSEFLKLFQEVTPTVFSCRAWASLRSSSETWRDIDLPVLSQTCFQNTLACVRFRDMFCSPVIVW